jgi:hypothetical protein
MDARLLVVLAGIGGAAAMQRDIGDANAERRANDFRYTPNPRVMKVVAGAHRSSLADVLWLRALPDMAREFNDRDMKRRWIVGATDVVTDLEPSFGTVYEFGAAHLSAPDNKNRNVDAAIALLQKGVRENPQSAGLHIALAMQYFMSKKDKARAIEELEVASELPGCDDLSMAMLASLKVKGHQDVAALGYWEKTLQDTSGKRARVAVEYEYWRTKKLIADRAAHEFRAQRGAAPAKPDDLRDPKLIDTAVIDAVLDGAEIDAAGLVRYARLDELERQKKTMQAEEWCAGFHDQEGRWPTEEEYVRLFGWPTKAPQGSRWTYADGKVALVRE